MDRDFGLDEHAFGAISAPNGRRSPGRLGQQIVRIVFILGCGAVLVSLVLPHCSHCDSKVLYRVVCVNNLKQIELALEGYHQKYGVLPPAYVADVNGRPMHSWRVLILPFLPFLEQSALHDQYDFTEPWDGPNNIKLLNSMPPCFACPSRLPYSKSLTSYVAISGPGTMFPGTAPARFADDIDGMTLMVVEASNVDIPWTSPTDLDVRTMSFQINDPKRPGIASKHPRGANAIVHGFGCEFVQETMPAQDVRYKATANDGTLVIQDDIY